MTLKAIKEKKQNDFAGVDADRLKLWIQQKQLKKLLMVYKEVTLILGKCPMIKIG